MTRRNVRVLVVEDDPNVRRDIVEVLEDEGYVVDEAAHGLEALDRVRTAWPDVVVLDLFMPLMDGWTFREELRAFASGSEPSIIILTADRYAREEATYLEAQGCLSKPFELDDLLRLLARIGLDAA